MSSHRILVTGGAGFIGSALIRHLVQHTEAEILNFDKLTYAANLANLAQIAHSNRYRLVVGDINDTAQVNEALNEFKPNIIFHLAAESHVDRSIEGPEAFIQTNIVGTFRLLRAVQQFWRGSDQLDGRPCRFVHVSTDEVYGALSLEDAPFTEETAYQPNSPYSASKASSDLLARAWHHTYALPTIITNCSNNYGPYQFPEKMIPLMIIKALAEEKLPVYGKGDNIRDWLHVEDHAEALATIAFHGHVGEKYNIGGNVERKNLDLVHDICDILDRLKPRARGSYRDLVSFVSDRPGHDFRYAIDNDKISRKLDWKPRYRYAQGLEQTVQWYIANEAWWRPILDGSYRGQRLGLAAVS